jgi:hypothetical protein
MTRRGGAAKGSGSKGCRGAKHGQACTKERTGAVAVRAALESAVQVGRGYEGNRQAEMANPTKCRDSLQANTPDTPALPALPHAEPRVARYVHPSQLNLLDLLALKIHHR